jgi:hypothetical protein
MLLYFYLTKGKLCVITKLVVNPITYTTEKTNMSNSSFSIARNTVVAIIKTLAAGSMTSYGIEKSISDNNKTVSIVLGALIETKIVKLGKGATPKYSLIDAKDALMHAEVIAAAIER